MDYHIKTTLNIDDTVMARLRQEAARRHRTMSELVEAGLRLLFLSGKCVPAPKLPALPKLRSGGHRVDVADRDALFQAMASEAQSPRPHRAGGSLGAGLRAPR